MSIVCLAQEDYAISSWAGGTTSQICIFPETAIYAEHNFLWRISTATVAVETSRFTHLPDYIRWITTLSGEIALVHDGGNSTHLVPYAVHRFDGASDTISTGKCTDFNLMLRKGACQGSLCSTVFLKSQRVMLSSMLCGCNAFDQKTVVLYCGEGSLELALDDVTYHVGSGRCVLISDMDEKEIYLSAIANTRILIAEIYN